VHVVGRPVTTGEGSHTDGTVVHFDLGTSLGKDEEDEFTEPYQRDQVPF